jgi:Asp-tRNA(Asn)/Glu-tRNA(Gln) amidotransferase A subunit family amidase
VEDAAILLDAIAEGPAIYQQSLRDQPKPFTLGIPRKYFFDDLDSEIAAAAETAIEQLKRHAIAVREIEIPIDEDRTLQAAEAYEYHRQMASTSPELYDPETLRRIRSGEGISESQYQEAVGRLARKRAEIARAFAEIDFLVTPTTPILAPHISELTKDPDLLRPAELVLLRNTRPMNVWGLPAISVPCGTTKAGLPIGVQIVGPPGGDARVLQIARMYEISIGR